MRLSELQWGEFVCARVRVSLSDSLTQSLYLCVRVNDLENYIM